MRRHNCHCGRSKDCNCCLCRGKCENDCDIPPTNMELAELRAFLPLLREWKKQYELRLKRAEDERIYLGLPKEEEVG